MALVQPWDFLPADKVILGSRRATHTDRPSAGLFLTREFRDLAGEVPSAACVAGPEPDNPRHGWPPLDF